MLDIFIYEGRLDLFLISRLLFLKPRRNQEKIQASIIIRIAFNFDVWISGMKHLKVAFHLEVECQEVIVMIIASSPPSLSPPPLSHTTPL